MRRRFMSAKKIPLKQWVTEEACKEFVCPKAIYLRLKKGWYKGVTVDRSRRNNFYAIDEQIEIPPRTPLKRWVHEMAVIDRRSVGCIRHRLRRGKYPQVQLERINARVVYVLQNDLRPQV